MVENFVGTWKMDSSENFEDYLKAIGVGCALRQVASRATPVMTFSTDGDGCICMKVKGPCKTSEVKFKLGEQFEESTPDGRKTTNVVNLQGGKLVHKQCWEGKEAVIERVIAGGKLITKFTLGDVVATRTFIKEA